MTENSSRIYVGNISEKVREDDILKEFERFGKIKRLDLKEKFAFLFYEDERNGEEAIRELNGYELLGSKLTVQYARTSHERLKEDTLAVLKNHRLIIENLDSKTSWQNIKDWARAAGMVSFTNVFSKDGKKIGIVEFEESTDIKEAIRTLEGISLLGMDCRLEKDEGQYGDQNRPTFTTGIKTFQDRRPPFSNNGGSSSGSGYNSNSRDSRDNRDYRSDNRSYNTGGDNRGGGGGGNRGSGGGYDDNRGSDRDSRDSYRDSGRGGGSRDRDSRDSRDSRSRAPPASSAPYYDNRSDNRSGSGGNNDRRSVPAPSYDDRNNNRDNRNDSRDRDRRPPVTSSYNSNDNNRNDNYRKPPPSFDDDRSRRPPPQSNSSYDDRDRDSRDIRDNNRDNRDNNRRAPPSQSSNTAYDDYRGGSDRGGGARDRSRSRDRINSNSRPPGY